LKSETRKLAVSGHAKQATVETPLTLDLAQAELGLVTVDLPLPTSIPAEYVPDKSLRLRLYRRLADLRDEAGLEAVSAEFAERFGPLPAPLENLIYQLRVKIKALRAGVVSVGSESGQIVLTLPPLAERENYAFGELGPGVRVSRNKIWLPRAASEGDWHEQVLRVLEQLEKDSAFR
jgi:transcription-repair coupling factor (superfamily II helicase)